MPQRLIITDKLCFICHGPRHHRTGRSVTCSRQCTNWRKRIQEGKLNQEDYEQIARLQKANEDKRGAGIL